VAVRRLTCAIAGAGTERSARDKQEFPYAAALRTEESMSAPTYAETYLTWMGGAKGEMEGALHNGVWQDSQNHSPQGTA